MSATDFERIETPRYYTKSDNTKREVDMLPTLVIKNMHLPVEEGEAPTILTVTDLTKNSGTFYNPVLSNELFLENRKVEMLCDVAFSDPQNNEYFEESDVTVKVQGDSTIKQVKHNFNFKLAKKHTYNPSLSSKKKFTIKADYSQFTHTWLNVWGNLWRKLYELDYEKDGVTYRKFDELPKDIRKSNTRGALLTRPCKVYYVDEVNDTNDYLGIYSLANPKDDIMCCFDEDKNPCGAFIMTYLPDDAGRGDIGSGASIYGTRSAYNFRAPWTGSETFLDDNGLLFEAGDKKYRDEKVRSFNKLIDIAMNTTDAEFKEQIVNYLDVVSVIDFLLMRQFICDSDGYKNVVYWTTNHNYEARTETVKIDGVKQSVTIPADKWHLGFYDFDGGFGSGGNWRPAYKAPNHLLMDNPYNILYSGCNAWQPGNLLFERILNVFTDMFQPRFEQIKQELFANNWMRNMFREEYNATLGYYVFDFEDNYGNKRPINSTTKYTASSDNTLTASATLTDPSGDFNFANPSSTLYTRSTKYMDPLLAQFESLYPFYIINNIGLRDRDVITIDETVDSINIYDYFTLGSEEIDTAIRTNAWVNKYMMINVSGDTGIIADQTQYALEQGRLISNTATETVKVLRDGTMNLLPGTGEIYVSVMANPYSMNPAFAELRYLKTFGKVVSPVLKIVRTQSAATDAEIRLLGTPYANELAYVECVPNGSFSSVSWSIDHGTIKADGTSCAVMDLEYTEGEYTVTAEITTPDGSFTKTHSFSSELPNYTYFSSNYGLRTNITNLKYSTLDIEGQFSIDDLSRKTPRDGDRGTARPYGSIVLFGGFNTAYGISAKYSNWIADTTIPAAQLFDGIALFINWRIVGDRPILNVNATFGNKILTNSTAYADIPVSFAVSSPQPGSVTSVRMQEMVYFRMNADYLQINNTKYPWALSFNSNNDSLKKTLSIYGLSNNSDKWEGKSTSTSRVKLYGLRIRENGVLTHDLSPVNATSVTNPMGFITDKAGTTTFSTTGTYSATGKYPSGSMGYNAWPAPAYSTSNTGLPTTTKLNVLGNVSRLPVSDEDCVAFNGDTLINLGIPMDTGYTYEMKIKPMFNLTSDPIYGGTDYRGRIFGARATNDSFGAAFTQLSFVNEVTAGVVVPKLEFIRPDKAATKPILPSCDISGTEYEIKLEVDKLTIVGSDGFEYTENIANPTVKQGGNIWFGSLYYNSDTKFADSYVNPGFYGYIYYFKVTDADGNAIADLTPNAAKTGFVDSVSGKEFMAYLGRSITGANIVRPTIEPVESDEFAGTTLQLTCESPENIVCATRRDPAFVNDYIDGSNNLSKVFRVANLPDYRIAPKFRIVSGDRYAGVSDDGLLTVYASASGVPISVQTYYDFDPNNPELQDTYELTVTYRA